MTTVLRQPLKAVLGMLALLLAACGESHEQMVLQLEELERQNRADSLMLNDSLALRLADYFDRHGSANERLRAHYILGRTYADMGNSPDALRTYHFAIDEYDTLAKDCDFVLLSKVYGQMASLYENHLLHRLSLSANKSASHYAMKGCDTLTACVFMERQVTNYCNLGLEDSALLISNHAVQQYKEHGDTLMANSSLAPVIMIYATRKEYSKMKELLDRYEFNSLLFHGTDSLKYENQYLLYYYKGLYYSGVHESDSAAIAFQHLLGRGRSLNNKGLGAKGLYDLYNEMGIPDSVIHYANLYTALNDSMASLLEQSMVYDQQMLYNYNQHQQHALKMEQLAGKERLRGIIIAVISLLLFLLLLTYRWHNVRKIREYKVKIMAYHQMQEKNKQESKRHDKEEHTLTSSAIRKLLAERVSKNEPATNEDWNEAASEILRNCPDFINTLNSFLPTINSIHLRICLAVKLRFSPAQIAILVSRSKQAITTARSRMYKEAFGEKGKPSDFDNFILSIS